MDGVDVQQGWMFHDFPEGLQSNSLVVSRNMGKIIPIYSLHNIFPHSLLTGRKVSSLLKQVLS